MSERISPEEHARYYTPEGCAQVRIPSQEAQYGLCVHLSEAIGSLILAGGFCHACPEYGLVPVSPSCRQCPPNVCYMPEHIAFIANAWIAQHDNV